MPLIPTNSVSLSQYFPQPPHLDKSRWQTDRIQSTRDQYVTAQLPGQIETSWPSKVVCSSRLWTGRPSGQAPEVDLSRRADKDRSSTLVNLALFSRSLTSVVVTSVEGKREGSDSNEKRIEGLDGRGDRAKREV